MLPDRLPASHPCSAVRMPAEWEPHLATWLAWPHNRETWPGVFDRVPRVWRDMVRLLRRHEEVRILIPDAAMEEEISSHHDLGEGHEVTFLDVRTNDAWIRDFGPVFTLDSAGRIRPTVWRFDSWGGKYPWQLDQAAGVEIAGACAGEWIVVDCVLEGGSIDSNGRGTLLATESCLLDAGRNPGLDRDGLEQFLEIVLGARHVIWLGEGIAGDDTDGHVDDLTRFVGPRTVVTVLEDDPEDPNYRPLRENRERLDDARDQDGNRLSIVELPMPDPVIHAGIRCPASYANFYIGQGTVLVPTFRCPKDDLALEILSGIFQDRDVAGIDCTDLVLGLGAIHCITCHEPAGLRETDIGNEPTT